MTFEIKFSAVVLLLATILSGPTHAADSSIAIGPIPSIADASPALLKTLNALRQRLESDARDCMESASAMAGPGNYRGSIKKALETSRLVSLEVSRVMVCDGVHSSGFRYGVAFDKKTGVRIDLSRVYNVATREEEKMFLRAELVESVKKSYRRQNAADASCLDDSDWEAGLTNFPLTFLPEPDGSLVLYYTTPDISSACFPPLHLSRYDVAPYRNAVRAGKYDLP